MERYRVVFVLQFLNGYFLGLDGHLVRSLRKAGRHPDPDNLMDTARFAFGGEEFELHRLFEILE